MERTKYSRNDLILILFSMKRQSTSTLDFSTFNLSVSSQNDSFNKNFRNASTVIQSSGVGNASHHTRKPVISLPHEEKESYGSNNEKCLEKLMPQLSLDNSSHSSLRSTITSARGQSSSILRGNTNPTDGLDSLALANLQKLPTDDLLLTVAGESCSFVALLKRVGSGQQEIGLQMMLSIFNVLVKILSLQTHANYVSLVSHTKTSAARAKLTGELIESLFINKTLIQLSKK